MLHAGKCDFNACPLQEFGEQLDSHGCVVVGMPPPEPSAAPASVPLPQKAVFPTEHSSSVHKGASVPQMPGFQALSKARDCNANTSVFANPLIYPVASGPAFATPQKASRVSSKTSGQSVGMTVQSFHELASEYTDVTPLLATPGVSISKHASKLIDVPNEIQPPVLPGLQVDALSTQGSDCSQQSRESAASGAETALNAGSGTTEVPTPTGDVGISVVLEVSRVEGALLRVSDLEADSTAEMSGHVRKGDLVISVEGVGLSGAEANANHFKHLTEGPCGTYACLRLMDPVTRAIRTVNLLRAMRAPQWHRFVRRQRRLLRALAGEHDPEGANRLSHYVKMCTEGPWEAVPDIVFLGTKGSGKTSLLIKFLEQLNCGEARLPRDYKHPTPGRGSMTSRVTRTLYSMQPEFSGSQPCTVTDTISLDAFGNSPEAARPFLQWLLTGKLQQGVTTGDISARTGCDAGSQDQWRPANGVIYLLDICKDCDIEWPYLQAVYDACQRHGRVPMVVGLTFQDKVAHSKTDLSKTMKMLEERLPRTVFFPLALTSNEDMSCAAVMEIMGRIKTLGVRHSLFGMQEATWQFSCDFAM
jgi:hypothetical protein